MDGARYFPYLHVLHWCLQALATGFHRAARYDGSPFRTEESKLTERYGSPCIKAAVLYVKADLLEFSTTLGYWSTAAAQHPCFLCTCQKDDMLQLDHWDAVIPPFAPKTWAGYLADCEAAEIWVTMTKAQHLHLRGILKFDKRPTGRGLQLVEDYLPLGLKKNDRLEPHAGCFDIESFERIVTFPHTALFWRASAERSTHRRNPLFSSSTGITPTATAALDWLHVLSLGIFQSWCGLVLGSMFDVDFWRTGEVNMHSRIASSCMRMTVKFAEWVKAEIRTGRKLTEIGQIKPEMAGTPSNPCCNLKGGETNGFLEWLVLTLRERKDLPDWHLVSGAGEDLFSMLCLIRSHPKIMPVAANQRFHRAAKGYLTKMKDLHQEPKPKDHFLIELANRISVMGSPQLYGNWEDESINRLVRDVAGGVHALVHEKRVLIEFASAHDNMRAGKTIAKRRRT